MLHHRSLIHFSPAISTFTDCSFLPFALFFGLRKIVMSYVFLFYTSILSFPAFCLVLVLPCNLRISGLLKFWLFHFPYFVFFCWLKSFLKIFETFTVLGCRVSIHTSGSNFILWCQSFTPFSCSAFFLSVQSQVFRKGLIQRFSKNIFNYQSLFCKSLHSLGNVDFNT